METFERSVYNKLVQLPSKLVLTFFCLAYKEKIPLKQVKYANAPAVGLYL
jgi:hypothetical protein